MFIRHLIPFFFLSACALFQRAPSLEEMDKQKLIEAVQVTGEGKGRLTLGQSKYVFSVDSVLNDKTDWILAVAIPLQGEEVMILPNLKASKAVTFETESFEYRIRREFQARGLEKVISSKVFLKELRSLIRFILSSKLGIKRQCDAQGEEMVCTMNGEKYSLSSQDKEFFIRKQLGKEKTLEVVAKNLTDSFFSNTDFHLYTTNKEPAFSLELFW